MKDGVILRVNKPARMGIDDASLYPLQPCLPRGLRSALLRKASVLRNWLLRKWDARQPSSAFSRSPLMLQSRVLLHCCVLRMCAETNFSHPFLRVAGSPVPCARMKDGVILRVSEPARMGIDDASLYPLQPCLPRGLPAPFPREAP